jgi:hypothetical protein
MANKKAAGKGKKAKRRAPIADLTPRKDAKGGAYTTLTAKALVPAVKIPRPGV